METEIKYQKCPKYDGQGTVSKPPYVPGDMYSWTSSSTVFGCDVCNGMKIMPMATANFVSKESINEIVKKLKEKSEHSPVTLIDVFDEFYKLLK